MDKPHKADASQSSLALFSAFALLLILITRLLIPWMGVWTGIETVLLWFLLAAAFVFAPMLVLAFLLLKREGLTPDISVWRDRMRFRRLSRSDVLWTLWGLFLIAVFSGIIMKGINMLAGSFEHVPPFMRFEPLSGLRYWLLLAWFPFWILNIMGEEILWRGVVLPRQENVFGKWTWLIHGFGWGLFHLAFGWQLLLTLVPILFIEPLIVVKTKNSWTGVIIHAGMNGPAFLAIALGLL